MKRNLNKINLTDEDALYARQIAKELNALPIIPDFTNDNSILIFSDYGGEHDGAQFYTYSFLICSEKSTEFFSNKSNEIRKKHSSNQPLNEYSYKNLKYKPIANSIIEILDAADNSIEGLLFTVCIDRKISSVFDVDKNEARKKLIPLLINNNRGDWKINEGEKLLRICHPLALLISQLTTPYQKITWISDSDSINTNGIRRNFSDTEKIFKDCIKRYSPSHSSNCYLKVIDPKNLKLIDALSLTDLAAGLTQEALSKFLHQKNHEVLTIEKQHILKWLQRVSPKLLKINFIFIEKNKSEFEVGTFTL